MTIQHQAEETNIYPLSIQFENKYWRIRYKDGELTSETNMEVDQATTILFEELKKRLGTLINQAYEEGKKEKLPEINELDGEIAGVDFSQDFKILNNLTNNQ